MNEQNLLQRIAINPKVMVGKPVVRGTRLTVQHILNLLGHGQTSADIIADYPGIQEDDIRACLLFAERSLGDISFMPLVVGA